MKKIRLLSLILALCMVVSLFAACGDEGYVDDDDDDDDEETVETTEETEDTTGPEETGEPEDTADPEDATDPDVPQPSMDPDYTEPDPSEPEVIEPEPGPGTETTASAGTWNGATYTNQYAGFKITFDRNWVYQNVTELQSDIKDVQDMLSGTSIGNAMVNVTQFYDMSASHSAGNNVNVVYQKLNAIQQSAYKNFTEENVIDATLAQKDAMIQAYEAMGLSVTSIEKVAVTFLGQTHYALKTVATTAGVPVYYLQFMDMSKGEWGITTTITAFYTDTTQEIADMFQPA